MATSLALRLNSLLIYSPAVRGGSATLSIYCRSGTDATGYIRNDVSAVPKLAIKSVHGCTLLMMRQRRCTPPARLEIDGTDTRSLAEIKRRRICDTLRINFFAATKGMHPCSAFANRGGRYKELGKKVPQAYLRYVEDTFLPYDAVDAPLFANDNDQLIFSRYAFVNTTSGMSEVSKSESICVVFSPLLISLI